MKGVSDMLRTIRIVVLIFLVVGLIAVNVSTAGAAPPAQAKWTVMVYMSGDNNLEDFISKDIETRARTDRFQRERPGGRARRPRPRL